MAKAKERVNFCFRIGPACQRATDVKKGDFVFIDPDLAGHTALSKLLLPGEIKQPVRVQRVEAKNNMIVVIGQRIGEISYHSCKRAVPISP